MYFCALFISCGMFMKVLTIIVSYNFMPWIDKCLGSLVKSAYNTDIIVIDNASGDDTIKSIKERYPEVVLIANSSNLGFGKANNLGIQYALKHNYDAVLLLNQDAWIESDTLGKLVEVSQKHPDYGILSPVHLNGSGNEPEKGFAQYTNLHDLDQRPSGEIVEVPFINAAIWFMPLQPLSRIGLFDPIFYHYGEDIDLANRMTYHNYKTGYVPSALGYHDRELRQVTRERFFKSEWVYHLSEYTNINYSFVKAFAMGALAEMKKSLLSLVRGHVSDMGKYAIQAFSLMLKTPAVLSARHRSKSVNLKNY